MGEKGATGETVKQGKTFIHTGPKKTLSSPGGDGTGKTSSGKKVTSGGRVPTKRPLNAKLERRAKLESLFKSNCSADSSWKGHRKGRKEMGIQEWVGWKH